VSAHIRLIEEVFNTFRSTTNNLTSSASGALSLGLNLDIDTSASSGSGALASLSELLPTVIELANTRVSKVVSVRSEQHAALDLPSFLVFFNESWEFVVKSEVLARRMIVGLRGVLVNQAKAFLLSFHNVRLAESAKLVENEQWGPADVSPASQHSIDVIVSAAVSDPAELILSVGSNSVNGGSVPPTPGTGTNAFPTANAKHANVEDRPYFAVSALLKVLDLLIDYLRVMTNFSLLTTDVMSRSIEFLKAFNSRTCQVVLGAGAMRSAGLKNITARHLALASQALSVMIALIPYVRETFRRHLNPKQAVIVVEFDKLKRDYQEHQHEIHSKLIAIMGDRLSVHCKTLREMDLETPLPPSASNTASPYMEVLVKETVTLHKVLSKYLSSQAVEMIMSQVFAAITHQLGEEYTEIKIQSAEAKARLLHDAHYLHQKLSALKGINLTTNMLETIVQEKPVPLRKSPFTTRRTSGMMTPPTSGKGDSEEQAAPKDAAESESGQTADAGSKAADTPDVVGVQ
jgi:vacuolar protein sorting-associated protein 54